MTFVNVLWQAHCRLPRKGDRTCGRSDVLIRQYSFINSARSSIHVHARLFLLVHTCSFIPAHSFLLVRSRSFVGRSCWLPRYTVNASSFKLVRCGSCLLVPARAFLLGRSGPFGLARSSILLTTVVHSRTGHRSLDALHL